MGTNYYLHYDICECCGRHNEKHIGKSSAGWQFSFRGYRSPEYQPPITSFEDWKKELQIEGKIFDEYGREISYEDFVALVEKKRSETYNQYDYCKEHSAWRNIDETDWKDDEGHPFSSTEFS